MQNTAQLPAIRFKKKQMGETGKWNEMNRCVDIRYRSPSYLLLTLYIDIYIYTQISNAEVGEEGSPEVNMTKTDGQDGMV